MGTIVETLDWRENRLFRGQDPAVLDRLAPLLVEERYGPGELILREGEDSDRICLLVSGSASVLKGPEAHCVGQIREGDYFGEMGVLDGTPRTTSVAADGGVLIRSLTRQAMERFRDETGIDLVTACLRNHAGVLSERLQRVNDVAVESMRQQMEEYRNRVSFGSLFANIIFLLFFYTSGLGLLRRLAETGSSSTLTTSVLLLVMGVGAAAIVRGSGFPLTTFGLTLANWQRVVVDALKWSAIFCAAITALKWAVVTFSPAHAHLPVISPWVSADGLAATLVAYGLYALLSPVQEFIGRGMLQGSLQKLLTGRYVTVKAIFLSNAVFSISHQHLGLGYALVVFIPGIFWGWMYARQQSLLGVSLSHVVIGLWGTGILDLASVVPA